MADRSYLDWPFFEERHRKLAQELDDWCRQTKWPHHGDSVDATDEACRQRVQLLAEGGGYDGVFPGNMEENTSHLTYVHSV